MISLMISLMISFQTFFTKKRINPVPQCVHFLLNSNYLENDLKIKAAFCPLKFCLIGVSQKSFCPWDAFSEDVLSYDVLL